jgi:hypothetical protein
MADIASRESLALKIYAETLSSFERKSTFRDLLTLQTIKSGKSAQFIVDTRGEDADFSEFTDTRTGTGDASAVTNGALSEDVAGGDTGVVKTHNLGVDSRTLATDILIGERTITVERPKIIRKNIDDFDAQIVPYNTRSIVTGQMGGSMSSYVDMRVLYELNRAMVSGGGLTNIQSDAGEVALSYSEYENASTREAKGDALVEAIFSAVAILDGKDQFGQERYFVCSNEDYYNILLSQKAVNRDFNAGDNGSISTGNVFNIGGVNILRSNRLGSITASNITSGNELRGYLLTKDVIGCTELYGLKTKQWDDDDYDQYIMKAQLAAGYGVLNTASLVAVSSDPTA